MVIVETKLDDSYPISQFHIEGYATPFRRDRNKYKGGILIYAREDIPCKLLDRHIFPDDIERLFVELNFRKSKLLLLGTYHPPSQDDNYYFQTVGNALEMYITKYEKKHFGRRFQCWGKRGKSQQFPRYLWLKKSCTWKDMLQINWRSLLYRCFTHELQ